MAKKTESLAYPNDPLQAIRDLQDLDDPRINPPKPAKVPEPVLVSLEDSLPDTPAPASADSSAMSSVVAEATKPKRVRVAPVPLKRKRKTTRSPPP